MERVAGFQVVQVNVALSLHLKRVANATLAPLPALPPRPIAKSGGYQLSFGHPRAAKSVLIVLVAPGV
jgi:hypothetical protein